MKTNRYHLQTEIERLRQAVEEAAGIKPHTPKDFELLADSIFDKLHQSVSVSTLKRLWGYVPTASLPREATLNLLARYVGYASWEDFCGEAVSGEPIPAPPTDDTPYDDSPTPSEFRQPRKRTAVMAVAALIVLVVTVCLVMLSHGRVSQAKGEALPQDSAAGIIRVGDRYAAPQEYLRRFGIIADDYLWGQVVPGHPDISVWGPQYHHPEWHNDGDSLLMLPTITEWWEPPTITDSAAMATRNKDRYLQYRRMNELRVTFMKDLVDTGYVFLGVYRLSLAQSDTVRLVWERVADEVDLRDIDRLERLR